MMLYDAPAWPDDTALMETLQAANIYIAKATHMEPNPRELLGGSQGMVSIVKRGCSSMTQSPMRTSC